MCYAMLKWIFVILDKFSKKMPLKMFLVKLKELKTVLFISFYKDQKSKKVLSLINKVYTTEENSLNIEELSLKFLKNFITKIVAKTNTSISLSATTNGIFTFTVA